jgi:hypothetical protein
MDVVTIHMPNASDFIHADGHREWLYSYVLAQKADQPNALQSPAPESNGRCAEYQMCRMSLLSQLCTEGKVHLS